MEDEREDKGKVVY